MEKDLGALVDNRMAMSHVCSSATFRLQHFSEMSPDMYVAPAGSSASLI